MTRRAPIAAALLVLLSSCGSVPGQMPPDAGAPPVALIDTRPEPPGANCVAGGTAVLVGLDRDGSGTLDAGEVDATSYVCNAPPRDPSPPVIDLEGDLLLRSQAEADRYQQLRTISGSLTFAGAGPIQLPALERIAGDLNCRGLAGGPVDLPALVAIARSVWWADCDTVRMPRLETIGNVASIGSRGAPLELPRLREVGSWMELSQNGDADLTLPALTTVYRLHVSGVATLSLPVLATTQLAGGARHVRAPVLTSTPSLWFTDGTETVDLPMLSSVDSAAFVNTGLLALHLPAAVQIRSLFVDRNPALAVLDLPALTALARLTVTNNPQLPTCQAEAIADRTGAMRTISGNGDGVCPP